MQSVFTYIFCDNAHRIFIFLRMQLVSVSCVCVFFIVRWCFLCIFVCVYLHAYTSNKNFKWIFRAKAKRTKKINKQIHLNAYFFMQRRTNSVSSPKKNEVKLLFRAKVDIRLSSCNKAIKWLSQFAFRTDTIINMKNIKIYSRNTLPWPWALAFHWPKKFYQWKRMR